VAGASATTDEGVRLDLANLATLRGDTAAAEVTLRSVMEARSQHLGADHFDTLEASDRLAELLKQTGRTAEAEALYTRRVQVLTAHLGAEHPQTLSARGRLALLLTEDGRSAEVPARARPARGQQPPRRRR
jgi:hypothetical protein